MQRPQAATLLHAWELGVSQKATTRALLLLAAAQPGATPAELAATGIGQRDALLLDLRAELFGAVCQCVANCAHCDERIEFEFPLDGIRSGFISDAATFEAEAVGYRATFRLPCSADLIAISDAPDRASAERDLLSRCLLTMAACDGGDQSPAELPPELVAAIDRRMGEVDSQSRVDLDVTCAVCGLSSRANFDIVTHLWTEIDAWAQGQLREVHTLATAYGWSEEQILALGPARRRAYLDFIGGC